MVGKTKDKSDDESDLSSESGGEGEQDENSNNTRQHISSAQERLLQTAQNEGEKLKKDGGMAKTEVETVKEGVLQWIPYVLDLTTADAAEAKGQQAYLTEREKFVREYKDKFRGGIKNNTIIHTLVDLWVKNSWKRAGYFKPLLQLILQIDPNILEAENEDGHLAFFQAIHERRPKLVKLLCLVAPSPELIIGKKQGKDNALHLAIKRNKSSFQSTIQGDLINSCASETLRDGDGDGNTPLHLAVMPNYFAKADSALVKHLVNKCSSTLNCENGSNITPFRYLHQCRTDFKNSKGDNYKGASRKHTAKKESGKNETGKDSKKHADSRSNPGLQRQNTGTNPGPQNTKDNTADSATSKYESNTKMLREPEKHEGDNSKNTRSSTLSDDQILSTFNSIESFLKKFILQNFAHSDASRLLYDSTSGGLSIDFNLLPVPANQRLSPEAIEKNYQFLRFESTLQYVALPNLLSLPETASNDRITHEGKENEPPTPTHYKKIFDWLRKTRQVQEILRVIVEDDLEHPHDDQTIEEAIQGLGVEVWDWRKYDISSETIYTAAPDVKEIYLYTTGNNTVLWGWSDEDGLRKLKNIEKIKLIIKGSSTPRVAYNVKMFKERLSRLISLDRSLLDKDCKMLLDTLHVADDNHAGSLIHEMRKLPFRVHAPQQPFEIEEEYEGDSKSFHRGQMKKTMTLDQDRAHKWLDCVDKCSQLVRNIITPKQRVKIALIDDGVDTNHNRLSFNVELGVTYCISFPGKEKVASSFYTSTSGHGTLMATLIQTVCPTVELYIAKLDGRSTSDSNNFTARSAADAVKWAVRMKVDIISMSWTIEKPKSARERAESQALGDLDIALLDAASKNILMFCAARDEGLEQPNEVPFPAASKTGNIFVIGAAAPSGAASTWVNKKAVHFLLPGTELRESRPKLMPPDMPVVDGSSPATALASGLAGLLLTILSADTTRAWDHHKREGRHDKINKILLSVKGDKNYVQVWDLFNKFTDNPRAEEDTAAFQRMVNSIRDR